MEEYQRNCQAAKQNPLRLKWDKCDYGYIITKAAVQRCLLDDRIVPMTELTSIVQELKDHYKAQYVGPRTLAELIVLKTKIYKELRDGETMEDKQKRELQEQLIEVCRDFTEEVMGKMKESVSDPVQQMKRILNAS